MVAAAIHHRYGFIQTISSMPLLPFPSLEFSSFSEEREGERERERERERTTECSHPSSRSHERGGTAAALKNAVVAFFGTGFDRKYCQRFLTVLKIISTIIVLEIRTILLLDFTTLQVESRTRSLFLLPFSSLSLLPLRRRCIPWVKGRRWLRKRCDGDIQEERKDGR